MSKNKFLARVARATVRHAKALLLLGALALPSHSWAYTECQLTPFRVYTDSGVVWITWTTGQSTYVALSDPAAKLYYTSALTALTSGRNMIVRIADGTTCAAIPASGMTFIGLWLI